jgi:hypothetical protein
MVQTKIILTLAPPSPEAWEAQLQTEYSQVEVYFQFILGVALVIFLLKSIIFS